MPGKLRDLLEHWEFFENKKKFDLKKAYIILKILKY